MSKINFWTFGPGNGSQEGGGKREIESEVNTGVVKGEQTFRGDLGGVCVYGDS